MLFKVTIALGSPRLNVEHGSTIFGFFRPSVRIDPPMIIVVSWHESKTLQVVVVLGLENVSPAPISDFIASLGRLVA